MRDNNPLGLNFTERFVVVEGEDRVVELKSKPGAVRMNLYFWIQPRPDNDQERTQSTVTFWEPYVGTSDGEFFSGDSA